MMSPVAASKPAPGHSPFRGLLLHHPDVGPERARHVACPVDRAPVDQDDLIGQPVEPREHVRQIRRLVQCRNHDGYTRPWLGSGADAMEQGLVESCIARAPTTGELPLPARLSPFSYRIRLSLRAPRHLPGCMPIVAKSAPVTSPPIPFLARSASPYVAASASPCKAAVLPCKAGVLPLPSNTPIPVSLPRYRFSRTPGVRLSQSPVEAILPLAGHVSNLRTSRDLLGGCWITRNEPDASWPDRPGVVARGRGCLSPRIPPLLVTADALASTSGRHACGRSATALSALARG